MGMSSSKFENETPFLSLTGIIATGDEWDGTNFNMIALTILFRILSVLPFQKVVNIWDYLADSLVTFPGNGYYDTKYYWTKNVFTFLNQITYVLPQCSKV